VIEQVLIDKDKFVDFFEFFEGNVNQIAGVEQLYEHIKLASPTLLARNAEWMEIYRDSALPEPPDPGEKPRWPLTKEQLGQIMLCPASSLPDSLMDDLADCYVTFLNSSKVGLAYFLGQCGHESAGLRYPLEIDKGYYLEGRCSDLGNCSPGDGPKFRGCGWIQVTGRNWAQQFSDQRTSIGKPDPKIMDVGSEYSCDVYPWSISGFWWQANDMPAYCEQMPDVDRVGQRVNGKYLPNGYLERREFTDRAFQVLGV